MYCIVVRREDGFDIRFSLDTGIYFAMMSKKGKDNVQALAVANDGKKVYFCGDYMEMVEPYKWAKPISAQIVARALELNAKINALPLRFEEEPEFDGTRWVPLLKRVRVGIEQIEEYISSLPQ